MVKRLLFILVSVFLLNGDMASANAGNGDGDLSTPRQAVKTHIENLQEGNYKPYKAGNAFPVNDSSKAKALAIKLKQIFDAKGLYVNYKEIPDHVSFKDSLSKPLEYVLFNNYPSIYVKKQDDKWQYAMESVKAIPGIHQQVFPFGTDKLVNLIPEAGQKKFLGLAIWQYSGMLILVLIAFLIHWIARFIFNRIIHSMLIKFLGGEDARRFEWAISGFFSWMLVLVGINWVLPILQLPVNFSHYFFEALRVLIPVLVILIFYRLIDILGVYMYRAAKKTESTFDDQLIPIVRKTLKGLIIVSGFLFILQNLNFNITGILAGLSIGGLAFALAAQETIKNLFGSLMIFMDRPFQVGDYVESGDNIIGTIEDVGFRSTRVRTFDQSLITVPNGKLADMTIDNMQMRFQRRFYTSVAITYDTPPALIETFRDGIRRLIEEHPKTDKSYYIVNLSEFGDSSVNIMIWCYFQTEDWQEELNSREELLLSIMRLAESIGVRFAFPTSTVHVEDFPGQLAKTPTHNANKGDFRKKLQAFFEQKDQQGNNG